MTFKKSIFLLMFLISVFIASPQTYFGTGQDGDLLLSSGATVYTDGTRSAAQNWHQSGIYNVLDLNTTIQYTNFGNFTIGDKVLVVQMEGGTVGAYIVEDLQSGSNNNMLYFDGATVSLSIFDFTGIVQAIKIPQWNRVIATNGTITCHAYDGSTGGIVMFCAFDVFKISLNGKVDASGKGYYARNINGVDVGIGGVGGTGGLADKLGFGITGTSGSPPGRDASSGPSVFRKGYNYPYLVCDGGTSVPDQYAPQGGAGGTSLNNGNAGSAGFSGSFFPQQVAFSLLIMGNCGDGGDGGKGGEAGGAGGGGAWTDKFYNPKMQNNNMASSGHNGQDGKPGGDGGSGGNGGGAIYIRAANVAAGSAGPYIISDGGVGGIGNEGVGNGGQGGKGGFGATGGCINYSGTDYFVPSGGGGAGGRSGDGSDGGNGGNGGYYGTIWVDVFNTPFLPTSAFSLVGGRGGEGGEGADPVESEDGLTTMVDLHSTSCGSNWEYCPFSALYIEDCKSDVVFEILGTMLTHYSSGTNSYHFDGPNNGSEYSYCDYEPISLNTYSLKCTNVSNEPSSDVKIKPDIINYFQYNTVLTDNNGSDCNDHFANFDQITSQPIGINNSTTVDFYGINNPEYDKTTDVLKYLIGNQMPCSCNCTPPFDDSPKKGQKGQKGIDAPSTIMPTPNQRQHQMIWNPSGLNEGDGLEIDFAIKPNPASNIALLTFVELAQKDYTIEIISNDGKIVESLKYKSFIGENSFNIGLEDIEEGNYIVKITSDDIFKTIKLNIQK